MYQTYECVGKNKNTVDDKSTGFADIYQCFVMADRIERMNREKALRAKSNDYNSITVSHNPGYRTETIMKSQVSSLPSHTDSSLDDDDYDYDW